MKKKSINVPSHVDVSSHTVKQSIVNATDGEKPAATIVLALAAKTNHSESKDKLKTKRTGAIVSKAGVAKNIVSVSREEENAIPAAIAKAA